MKKTIAFVLAASSIAVGAAIPRERRVAQARELAASGIVLLENKNSALPLNAGEEIVLAGVTGYFCHRMGWGSGDMLAHKTTQYDEGLVRAGVKVDAGFAKVYRDFLAKQDYSRLNRDWAKWTNRFPEPDLKGDAFAKLAEGKRGKKCVVVIGRGAGESEDIKEAPGGWRLHPEEDRLLADACASFDTVVVLLNVPGVIDTSFMDKYPVDALVFTSFLGETSGDAVADVLIGKVNPSGKTVDTWAREYMNYQTKDCWDTMKVPYNEFAVSYELSECFPGMARYQFGYGLSYTTFQLTPTTASVTADGEGEVSVSVANAGKTAGADVVQCYFQSGDPETPMLMGKRLCAFVKTPVIEPGKTVVVTLKFSPEDIAVFDEASASWIVPEGDWRLFAGDSLHSAVVVKRGKFEKPVVVQKVSSRFTGSSRGIERKRNEFKKPESFVRFGDVMSGKAKVEDIVAQFSDEELVAVVNGRLFDGQGYNLDGGTGVGGVKKGRVDCEAGETWSSDKYGFGAITMADGPSGVRLSNFNEPKEKYNKMASEAVSWPCGTALAQGWDVAAAERFGRAVSTEMEMLDIDCWLAPGVNIHRNPLCGRNFEYFSEDPLVAGLMGAAIVKGVQTKEDGTPSGRSATVKHFAVNNQEFERGAMSAEVCEKTLREIYLKPFEIVVRRSQPNMLMSSYNKLNGDYCATTYDLLTGVLREEWGFRGFVMTDWWNAADKLRHASAGNDLIMPGVRGEYNALVAALKDGKVRRADLQRAAANILSVYARIASAQGR